MSLPKKLLEILAEIEDLASYDEKCDFLIELASDFKGASNLYQKPYSKDNQVPGCESEVYLWVKSNTIKKNTFIFDFIVENPQGVSAKAMAQILNEGLSEATKEEILSVPDEIVYKVFGAGLSMGKGQGLMGMIRLLKCFIAKF